MATIKRIIKGDTVKIISGANKGTTGKVLAVLTKITQFWLKALVIFTAKLNHLNKTHVVDTKTFMFQHQFTKLR
jgi:ribosomal protein L24